jgi:hypothetical protein
LREVVVAVTLRDWLEGCGCFDIREVEVKIGRTTYRGCRAKQKRSSPPGGYAAKDIESGEREFVYLLGAVPAVYHRSRRVCFAVEGEPHEWYLVMWVTPETASHPTYWDFHFEGNGAFMLQPWTLDEAIDKFESSPYQRVSTVFSERVAA